MTTKQQKLRACYLSNKALREGRIIRRPCVVCQNPKAEMHHPDYTEPLEIQWLCRKHHKDADKVRRMWDEDENDLRIMIPSNIISTERANRISHTIEPDKEYSLKDIRDKKFIPWALHYKTLRKVINGKNKLDVTVIGKGRLKRYKVRGLSIINYINKCAEDLMIKTTYN